MALTKEKKKEIIEQLKEKIAKQKAMIFCDISGLKVKDLTKLRRELKSEDSGLKVAKKTLLRIALKEKKIDFDPKNLKGEIAIIFGFKDEIKPAKITFQFSNENENLKILAGFLENQFVGAEKIIELAKLPTKDELLRKLIFEISNPVSSFIYLLKENLRNLVFILQQISQSKVNQ